MNDAKVELGRWLFHDTRLSGNGTMSCATCHKPESYFTDGLTVGIGAGVGTRHTMTVVGVVADGRYYTINEPPRPAIFLAFSQDAASASYLVISHFTA